MARFVRPSIRTRFALRRLPARFAFCIFLSLALAGCATKRPRVPPPEPSASTVAKTETSALPIVESADSQVIQASANVPPTAEAAEIPIDDDFANRSDDQVLFTLPAAIDFALDNNPRLRSARAAILRASGAEQAAFAPFLPQVDLLTQLGAVSSTLAPGVPGTEGFILSSGTGTRTYAQAELGLQWMLYDFGRISGRHMQAVWREQIAEFQLVRARQTVEFDVSATYLDVLLANASRRVEEDAVRRAESILHDTSARRQNGDALLVRPYYLVRPEVVRFRGSLAVDQLAAGVDHEATTAVQGASGVLAKEELHVRRLRSNRWRFRRGKGHAHRELLAASARGVQHLAQ
jgi:hypothetical protein